MQRTAALPRAHYRASLDARSSLLTNARLLALLEGSTFPSTRSTAASAMLAKFPQPDATNSCFGVAPTRRRTSRTRSVARTMLAMSRACVMRVIELEGRIFRYSTTRDWRFRTSEKMAEDHAGSLRVLATLVFLSPTEITFGRRSFRRWSTFAAFCAPDPQTGFFGGSQDADEAYDELSS